MRAEIIGVGVKCQGAKGSWYQRVLFADGLLQGFDVGIIGVSVKCQGAKGS